MRARHYILILLLGSLLLQQQYLSAQEYLDLWRNGKTDNFYLIQQKFNEYFANRDKGRGTGYKQFKRWEYIMAPRVYPSGKLINPARLALDEELRYAARSGRAQSRMPATRRQLDLSGNNGLYPFAHRLFRRYGQGQLYCTSSYQSTNFVYWHAWWRNLENDRSGPNLDVAIRWHTCYSGVRYCR